MATALQGGVVNEKFTHVNRCAYYCRYSY